MRISINFASRGYLLFRKVYVVLLAAIIAGTAVFAGEYYAFQGAASRDAALQKRLAALEKVYVEAQRKDEGLKRDVPAGGVKALARQADFANAAISTQVFSWTAFLNRLEDVVPDGVGITSINPDFESLSVDISGTALNLGQATEFVDRLTKSPYFADIPPAFHTSEVVVDKDVGKTLQTFTLKINYNPDGRGKDGAPRKEGSS